MSAPLNETAPKLAELTTDVLFGDVWERPGLSKRDRSLLTELVTHLAFYAGWPAAVTAADRLAATPDRPTT